MTIQDVYTQYNTPGNLQRHMLDVAGMVCAIKDKWIGRDVDWGATLTAALLHDVGNIVKFDLDKYPHLLGSEQPRIEYWRDVQQSTIKKYGNNDHVATTMMLQEMSISKKIIQIISKKSFGNSAQLRNSNDSESRLLLYCDLRILPGGLGSLDSRLKDIKERLTKYSRRTDFDDLVDACYDIEDDINRSVSLDIRADIDTQALDTFTKNLRQYEL